MELEQDEALPESALYATDVLITVKVVERYITKLQGNPTIKTIRLYRVSFKDTTCIESLCSAIFNLDIEKVSIRNCNEGISSFVRHFSQYLPYLKLTTLHIHNTRLNDNDCMYLATATSMSNTLVSFRISNIEYISHLVCGRLVEVFNLRSLTHVNISHVKLTNNAFEKIRLDADSESNLVSVKLRHVGLDHLSVVDLWKFLYTCKNLMYIDISDNAIGDVGMMRVLGAFERWERHPKYLNFANNQITSTSIEYLARFLKRCNGVKKLVLGGNSIGDEGLVTLCDIFQESTTLTRLDVSCDETITSFDVLVNLNRVKTLLKCVDTIGCTNATSTDSTKATNHLHQSMISTLNHDTKKIRLEF